jgi:hypothetical protein
MAVCSWGPDTTQRESAATALTPPLVRIGDIWPPRGQCGQAVLVFPSPFGGGGAILKVLLDEKASNFGYRVTLLSGSYPCGTELPDSLFCAASSPLGETGWWGRLLLRWPLCDQARGRVRFAVAVHSVDCHGNVSALSDTIWVTNRCTTTGETYK